MLKFQKRKIGYVVLAAVTAGWWGYWYLRSDPNSPAAHGILSSGAPAPEFRWPDITGQTASLSNYRGKVVLLDFWATWCDSCMEEMPAMRRLYSSFAPQGVEFLGASVEYEGIKNVVDFAHRNKIPWRVLIAEPGDIEAYGVAGLPTKYLIDSQGVVVKRYIGWTDTDQLARDIRSLLLEKRPSDAIGMRHPETPNGRTL